MVAAARRVRPDSTDARLLRMGPAGLRQQDVAIGHGPVVSRGGQFPVHRRHARDVRVLVGLLPAMDERCGSERQARFLADRLLEQRPGRRPLRIRPARRVALGRVGFGEPRPGRAGRLLRVSRGIVGHRIPVRLELRIGRVLPPGSIRGPHRGPRVLDQHHRGLYRRVRAPVPVGLDDPPAALVGWRRESRIPRCRPPGRTDAGFRDGAADRELAASR